MAVLLATGLVLVASCGDDGGGSAAPGTGGGAPAAGPEMEDPGPVHVHGLGVNPRDGSLFIATHTGLFRAPPGRLRATRVGDRFQDTMGFTVVGPDRFLGSGHPDGRDGLPPFLGLVRSVDAGRTWEPVSLLGKADFHVLESAGRVVYGHGQDFETREDQLLVSEDGGRSWKRRVPPEPLLSLAVEPGRAERLVASGAAGLYSSADGGRGWRSLPGKPGLLAFDENGTLYRAAAGGIVSASADGGRSWEERGRAGGEAAAFEAHASGLLLALHDGTVRISADGGRAWRTRSRP